MLTTYRMLFLALKKFKWSQSLHRFSPPDNPPSHPAKYPISTPFWAGVVACTCNQSTLEAEFRNDVVRYQFGVTVLQ